MKKKILMYIVMLMLLCCSLVLTVYAQNREPSEGLAYSPNGDGTCAVTGLGSCTDTELMIPEMSPDGYTVTEIAAEAFMDCTGITSITLPITVKIIGDNAFAGCSSLNRIDLQDGITSIGMGAFGSCVSIEALELPKTVTSIGDLAFDGTSLKTITMPAIGATQSVTRFDKIFGSATALEKVIFNGGKCIGAYSFAGCSSLKSVVISPSITEVWNDAFSDCDLLDSIYISDIDAWCGIEFHDAICKKEYDLYLNDVPVTDLVIPEGVVNIGYYMLGYCRSIKTVVIPGSAERITDNAFYACPNLESVTMSAGTTSIEMRAFAECPMLKTVVFPDTLDAISLYVFENCVSLTSLTFPEGMATVREGAFTGCTGLTAIELPAGVSQLEGYIFDGCTNLKEIRLLSRSAVQIADSDGLAPKDTVLYGYEKSNLEAYAARYDYKYVDLDLLEGAYSSLTFIPNGDGTCSVKANEGFALDVLNIPEMSPLGDRVTSIADGAFTGCTSLISVKLNDGMASIGNDAFSGCTSLADIITGEGLVSIGTSAFEGCTGLTEFVFPESVEAVGARAFMNCTGIVRAELFKDLISVGEQAFYGCDDLRIFIMHSDNAVIAAPDAIPMTTEIYGRKGSGAEAYAVSTGNKFTAFSDAEVYISSASVHAGDTVTVDVLLRNAENIRKVYLYDIKYNKNALELIGGEWVLSGILAEWDSTNACGELLFSDNTDANGVICRLTFRAKENAKIGNYSVLCSAIIKYANDTLGDVPMLVSSVSGVIRTTEYLLGDFDGNLSVDSNDAIYLLWHTFMPNLYPIYQNPDLNGDMVLDSNDAIHLLWHTFTPEFYPIPDICNHDIVKDQAVLPADGSSPLTEGLHCARCNEIIVAQYHPDVYNSRYGYSHLATLENGESLQALYNRIDTEAMSYHLGGGTDSEKIYLSDLRLSENEVLLVLTMYFNEHQLYYWYGGYTALTNSENGVVNSVEFIVPEEYRDPANREQLNLRIYQAVQENAVLGLSTYDTAKYYYDIIARNMYYAYEADGITPEDAVWAHNIIGFTEYGAGVCETYSEIFHIMMNFSGVECIRVTGDANGPHAWNMAKMDDGNWYWFDITWDDRADGYTSDYFCVNDDQAIAGGSFITTHNPAELYVIPERSAVTFGATA